ncbi:MAG: PfkB family carbohydrate kinase [Anaerolineae bacterium]|jgi:ribokinase
MGVPTVIVTLGLAGALIVDSDGSAHVRARRVQVVDATATGDAFIGGLAVGLTRELPIRDAVRYATCAETLAVTRLGT